MVRLAEALGESGITRRFAEGASSFTSGWQWWAALAVLALIYFYAHYASRLRARACNVHSVSSGDHCRCVAWALPLYCATSRIFRLV